MTNATQDCTGCPVSAGTHKPADAVHTEIAEPSTPAVPEPWGACVGGRIWIGKLPDHVHKLAAQEGVAIQWLYTEQQVRAMLATNGAGACNPDAPAHPAEGVPAPVAVGMREAFEAWARNYGTWEVQRDDDSDLGTTGYTDVSLTVAWHAVQARAALAATPAAPDGELEATQDMLTTARTDLELLREALSVPYEPHQSLLDRMLEAAKAAGVPAAAPDARDAAFEAVRKKFCKLPRYSFLLDDKGNVRRVPQFTGNWVEFDAVHTLFEPQAVDAAIAAQAGKGVQ